MVKCNNMIWQGMAFDNWPYEIGVWAMIERGGIYDISTMWTLPHLYLYLLQRTSPWSMVHDRHESQLQATFEIGCFAKRTMFDIWSR